MRTIRNLRILFIVALLLVVNTTPFAAASNVIDTVPYDEQVEHLTYVLQETQIQLESLQEEMIIQQSNYVDTCKITNNIKIYLEPNSQSKVVGVYPKDSLVNVYDLVDNKWFKTDDGYIYKGYVQNLTEKARATKIMTEDEFEQTKNIQAKPMVAQANVSGVKVEPMMAKTTTPQAKKTYNVSVKGKSGLNKDEILMILDGSPMDNEKSAEAILKIEEDNNVNAFFTIGVANTETGLGKTGTGTSKRNAFGLTTTKGGYASYNSLANSIIAFGGNIERVHFNNGRSSVEAINRVYCPTNVPGWTKDVKTSMNNAYMKLNVN